MIRTRCGSCRSVNLQRFLHLGKTPLADAFPSSPDEPEALYSLGLLVCQDCWLVQNTEVVPDDLLYNEDYGFYTGASPSSIAYFKDYAEWAIERFDPRAIVIEIASNDGTLLRNFPAAQRLGIEPSANVAAAAIASGVPTIAQPFGRRVANEISGNGRASLIIANNVVAHVSDLDDFLGGIADLLAPEGTALIEFQYVADLLLGNQFDHVYHEHRSFFSLSSLDYALRPHGLYIEDFIRTPAQGGSIRAIVRHGDGGRDDRWPQEGWLRSFNAYAGVQGRIDHLRASLRDLVAVRCEVGPVVGYGATAKSTTLLNYCGLDTWFLDYVEDLTPTKVGRYTPGTHIPILSPKEAAVRRTVGGEGRPTYLLLAWNYLAGILDREREHRAAGGRFIVPIPVPVLL